MLPLTHGGGGRGPPLYATTSRKSAPLPLYLVRARTAWHGGGARARAALVTLAVAGLLAAAVAVNWLLGVLLVAGREPAQFGRLELPVGDGAAAALYGAASLAALAADPPRVVGICDPRAPLTCAGGRAAGHPVLAVPGLVDGGGPDGGGRHLAALAGLLGMMPTTRTLVLHGAQPALLEALSPLVAQLPTRPAVVAVVYGPHAALGEPLGTDTDSSAGLAGLASLAEGEYVDTVAVAHGGPVPAELAAAAAASAAGGVVGRAAPVTLLPHLLAQPPSNGNEGGATLTALQARSLYDRRAHIGVFGHASDGVVLRALTAAGGAAAAARRYASAPGLGGLAVRAVAAWRHRRSRQWAALAGGATSNGRSRFPAAGSIIPALDVLGHAFVTALAAACAVPKATVHVQALPPGVSVEALRTSGACGDGTPIVVHGPLTQAALDALVPTLDVALWPPAPRLTKALRAALARTAAAPPSRSKPSTALAADDAAADAAADAEADATRADAATRLAGTLSAGAMTAGALAAWAAGVPTLLPDVLAARALLDFDADLAAALVVRGTGDVPATTTSDDDDAIDAGRRAALTAALVSTLAQRDALAPRLLAASSHLHARARQQWAALTRDDGAGAQAPPPPYVPVTGPPPLPPAQPVLTAAAAAAAAAGGGPPPRRVAFLTSALGALTPGSHGAVVAGLAGDLLAAGHSVLVVGHLPCHQLAAWRQRTAAALAGELGSASGGDAAPRLATLCASELLDGATDAAAARRHDEEPGEAHALQAAEYARAAVAAYRALPFDVLELPDHGGLAAGILRARAAAAAGGGDAAGALPPHVRVVVRAYGATLLVDAAEGALPHAGSTQRALYASERYALTAADAVVVPSEGVGRLYTRVFGLWPQRVHVGPLPVGRLLAPLHMEDAGGGSGGDDAAVARWAARLSRTQAQIDEGDDEAPPESWEGEGGAPPASADSDDEDAAAAAGGRRPPPSLLVLGKLSLSKGSHTLGTGLASLFAEYDDRGPLLTVHFVGADSGCAEHGGGPMRACVTAAVGGDYAHRLFFHPPVPHHALPAMVAAFTRRLGLVAAVVPSSMDTFNLAAHELARERVPLVLSDIPAFQEHWGNESAFVFRHGDAASLMGALLDALTDDAKRARLHARPPLAYGDAAAVYARL